MDEQEDIAPKIYDSIQALDMNCEIRRGFCMAIYVVTRSRPSIQTRYVIIEDKNRERHKCLLQSNRYSFGKIIPCRIVLTEKYNPAMKFNMRSKYEFNERRNFNI